MKEKNMERKGEPKFASQLDELRHGVCAGGWRSLNLLKPILGVVFVCVCVCVCVCVVAAVEFMRLTESNSYSWLSWL